MLVHYYTFIISRITIYIFLGYQKSFNFFFFIWYLKRCKIFAWRYFISKHFRGSIQSFEKKKKEIKPNRNPYISLISRFYTGGEISRQGFFTTCLASTTQNRFDFNQFSLHSAYKLNKRMSFNFKIFLPSIVANPRCGVCPTFFITLL